MEACDSGWVGAESVNRDAISAVSMGVGVPENGKEGEAPDCWGRFIFIWKR